MTRDEQLECWIEKRIIERKATRGEVYALRRLRRRDNMETRAALAFAYFHAVYVRPRIAAIQRITEAMTECRRGFGKLATVFSLAVMEDADQGEFDNRAQDWIS